MADERCVSPGNNPRTPGRWLNRDTAERLLRGEPLDNAVAPEARDQAQRLAQALAALSAPPLPADAEPPGEAAALAAFRKARDERAAEAFPETGEVRELDAGVVRIGGRGGGRASQGERRPRWGRSVRLGLSAVLAAGMVGGVAAAVGVGVLPKPFGGSEPAPGASVSAPGTPDEHPLLSPSPELAPGGEAAPTTPDGSSGSASPRETPGGTQDEDSGDPSAPDTGWSGAPSACRDLRDGRELDATRRRTLEEAAGGSSRVPGYCQEVLAGDAAGRNTGNEGKNKGKNKGDEKDRGRNDNGQGQGQGQGQGRGHGGKGGSGGRGGDENPGGDDARGHRGGRGGKAGKPHAGGHGGGHGRGHHQGTGSGDHSGTGTGHHHGGALTPTLLRALEPPHVTAVAPHPINPLTPS
ncbi:hypothetical protein ACGFNV_09730 [Streptomyces sp. NPDC048751]|uniref:hypothetical protein n=1 Tax=Streptomyces sp. NPDC048751 TaxID=3365591 RepID=UPI00372039A7